MGKRSSLGIPVFRRLNFPRGKSIVALPLGIDRIFPDLVSRPYDRDGMITKWLSDVLC